MTDAIARGAAAGVDIGGTFTDIVVTTADGGVRIAKVLSTPADYGDAILAGLGACLGDAVGAGDIARVAHGTTVASNAVLEGSAAAPALVTSDGFRDVLEIGRLRLPKLYDVAWEKPRPLVPRALRLEVTERIGADGTVVVALDEASVERAVAAIRAAGVRAAAISLINAYVNPAHEMAVREIFTRLAPEIDITVATDVSRQIREVERTSTAVVNAYLRPVLKSYLGALRRRLDDDGIGAPLFISQSTGGLTTAAQALDQPVTILESGPAAGVVAASALAAELGIDHLISFDMGGTTAKAASVEHGRFVRTADFAVGGGIIAGSRLLTGAGHPLQVPAVDLAEVGAGGGSIIRIDAGGALVVGPESAGSTPGPVCYGRGGTRPTVTDAAAILGYLNPAGIAGGSVAIDVAAARQVMQRAVADPLGLSVEDAAFAAVEIANSTMLRALRAVSSERGRDPRQYTLAVFGGNGPLFGPLLGEHLGTKRVLVPPLPGIFSAVGLLIAEMETERSETFRMPLDGFDASAFAAARARLADMVRAELSAAGFPGERQRFEIRISLRYVGQTHALPVPVADDALVDAAMLRALFGEEHERSYGHRAGEGERVEITTIAVTGKGLFDRRPGLPALQANAAPEGERSAYFGPARGFLPARIVSRAALRTPLTGPAIVEEFDSTCLVPPGATACLLANGTIDITLAAPASLSSAS